MSRLAEVSAAIVAGVRHHGASYVEDCARVVLDAWARLAPDRRAQVDVEVHAAAEHAAERMVAELSALFELSAAEQRVTPLQIVRTIVREPTAVLARAGIPPVMRDAFEERAFPDDAYGLAPATLADLGDPDLGPMQLAWGLAKTAVLRGS